MNGAFDPALAAGGALEAALFGSPEAPGLLVWAFAVFLGLTRAAAAFSVAPMLSYLGLRGMMRIVVAGALAAPAALGLPAGIAAMQPDMFDLLALTLKELVVGVGLGLLIGLPFWAAEMAGAAIDQQRMAVSAVATQPDQRTETTVLGLFFALLYLGYVFATDTHLALFDIVYRSYGLWPALSYAPTAALDLELGLGFLQEMFVLSLILAGPIVFLLLLSDLGVAAMARFAPQMNAMLLAMQAKSLLITVAVLLYLGLMFDAFGRQFVYFDGLRALMGGGG